jgi:hypothetical protein
LDVVNIINSNLENQRLTGRLMQQGFEALGHAVKTTTDRTARGDITVVHGCNYAKDFAEGRVLWLDRCWYGRTTEWVSLGWKVNNHARIYAQGGSQRFKSHVEQGHVELAPMKAETSTIVIDGYPQALKGKYGGHYRAHPARASHTDTLAEAMEPYSHAITEYGTCAAQAWLAGLTVDCHDPHNIVHTHHVRETWANDLAWTQFTNAELASGYAIKHLLDDGQPGNFLL